MAKEGNLVYTIELSNSLSCLSYMGDIYLEGSLMALVHLKFFE